MTYEKRVGVSLGRHARIALVCVFATFTPQALGQSVSELETAELSSEEEEILIAAIDLEIEGSATEAGALEQAKRLEAAGNFSGASVVLERILLVKPEAIQARAAYARLLCLLDDKQAGQYELAKLRTTEPDADTIEHVEEACRPAEVKAQ